jgi:hypothetical protein
MQIVERVIEWKSRAFETADGLRHLCVCDIAARVLLLIEREDTSMGAAVLLPRLVQSDASRSAHDAIVAGKFLRSDGQVLTVNEQQPSSEVWINRPMNLDVARHGTTRIPPLHYGGEGVLYHLS